MPQDLEFELTPDTGSDSIDARIFMRIQASGRRSVLILENSLSKQGNYFHIWFFDASHRTYKAIQLTGAASDADRVFSEMAARRPLAFSRTELREHLARRWAEHLARLRGRNAGGNLRHSIAAMGVQHVPLPESHNVPDGTSDLGFPPTAGQPARDGTPYCYGSIDWFTYFEDPVWINVAETSYGIEFNGNWNTPTVSGPSCWAKDPGWWPPPANTDWDVEECSDGGWSGGGGFDKYALTAYINWDWGNNSESTGVLMQPGLQYVSSFNPYMQHDQWGEDNGYLTFYSDNSYNYFCEPAPRQANVK